MKQALHILFITLILFQLTACGGDRGGDAVLSKLDSLIDRRDDFERAKLMRLAELRAKRNAATTASERYQLNSMLFDEYVTFNSDSAMRYVEENLNTAAREGDSLWYRRSIIDKSNLLAATGLLKQNSDGNVELNGKNLEQGATYRMTIDMSKGIESATLNLIKL